MGLGAVAAHLVIFIAMASAGTILAGVAMDAASDNVEAQSEALDRMQRARTEQFSLTSQQYVPGPGRVETEWGNDGSDEVLLSDLTILVNGIFTASSSADIVRFQVEEDTSSNIWMPGETLELWVDVDANVDVTIVGPYGGAAYRRA